MTYLTRPNGWLRYRFPANSSPYLFTLLKWQEVAAEWLLNSTFKVLSASLRGSHKVIDFLLSLPPTFSGIDFKTHEFVCGWCGTRTAEGAALLLSCCKHEANRLFPH